jgi:hypothetical protein
MKLEERAQPCFAQCFYTFIPRNYWQLNFLQYHPIAAFLAWKKVIRISQISKRKLVTL